MISIANISFLCSEDIQNPLLLLLEIKEWAKKLWNIHTMDYYLETHNNEILPFAVSLINLEELIVSEIIYTVR